jgi:hypothetical protein
MNADSLCIFCSVPYGKKTAEMLYMSQEWDYYYCYRCRRWFKKHYNNHRIILPIGDKTEIRHLTWFYASHLESVYEQRKLLDRMESIWHQVGKHLPRR